jgi:prevent-host-death family protein
MVTCSRQQLIQSQIRGCILRENDVCYLWRGDDSMSSIKPISDLRNYGKVLHDVAIGAPVFLTKHGREQYAVVDIAEYKEYEKILAWQKLKSELDKGRHSGDDNGWIPAEEVKRRISILFDENKSAT